MTDRERLDRVIEVAKWLINNSETPAEIHTALLVLDAVSAPERVTAAHLVARHWE